MQKFSAAKVAVVGIDVWNSSDSLIGAYLSLTGVTFPVMRGGAATGSSYGVVANSMVVVDQNGIVQYIRQLGTASTTSAIMSGMVSEAASTVRGLLTNNVLQFSHMGNGAVNKQFVGNSEFTLLGRKAPRRAVSTNLLVSKNGKPRPMPLFH